MFRMLGLLPSLFSSISGALPAAISLLLMLASTSAQAVPSFANQTGQSCVACHAGGQFPELTPYGRSFKLNGYTFGTRTMPLSAMGLVSSSKVGNTSKSDNPPADFQKNGAPILAMGSVFLAGKLSDNLGGFIQWTYDNYAGQTVDGKFQGHSNADNIDLRYVDRLIDAKRDLIFGVSLNNNPSVADPWNTAAAWMQYVPVPSPTSSSFIDGKAPYPGFATGQSAGISVYAYLNKMVYAELGGYQTANKGFSILSAGSSDANTQKLKGINPYWRLALSHEWGPSNIMVGTSGMVADVYDNASDTSDPNSVSRSRNMGIDAQYQYLLDPHTVTAQIVYMRQKTSYSAASGHPEQPSDPATGNPYVDANGNLLPLTNTSDTLNTLRAKLSYIYQHKYGGSLSFFNLSGTSNSANQTSGLYDSTTYDPANPGASLLQNTRVYGNASGNPDTRGWTTEAFWMPIQNIRIGAQYTMYSKLNGASTNYDGAGRDAKDNNSLFFYVWGAY